MAIHSDLTQGRWQQLSLAEQLGNIGSEISRVRLARRQHNSEDGPVARALELMDLTKVDPRWHAGRRELSRLREVFVDALSGGHDYATTLDDLQNYCDVFAFQARLGR